MPAQRRASSKHASSASRRSAVSQPSAISESRRSATSARSAAVTAAGLTRSGSATAAAQASDGQADPALATLLDAVREGPGDTRDKARGLMLDVFRLLGDDHPLTSTYRKALTRALF